MAIRYKVDLSLYTNNHNENAKAENKQSYNPMHVLNFRSEYFYILIIQIFNCGVNFTFVSLSAAMLQNVHNLSLSESSFITTFFGILSIFSEPITGIFVKLHNKKIYITMISVLLGLTAIVFQLLY